jgi:hypothetical protein
MASFAALAAAFHDPGFDVVACCELRESFFRDDSRKTGQRPAHEKRPLLPVMPQELLRRTVAKQA